MTLDGHLGTKERRNCLVGKFSTHRFSFFLRTLAQNLHRTYTAAGRRVSGLSSDLRLSVTFQVGSYSGVTLGHLVTPALLPLSVTARTAGTAGTAGRLTYVRFGFCL